jgi:hypothetical protein
MSQEESLESTNFINNIPNPYSGFCYIQWWWLLLIRFNSNTLKMGKWLSELQENGWPLHKPGCHPVEIWHWK